MYDLDIHLLGLNAAELNAGARPILSDIVSDIFQNVTDNLSLVQSLFINQTFGRAVELGEQTLQLMDHLLLLNSVEFWKAIADTVGLESYRLENECQAVSYHNMQFIGMLLTGVSCVATKNLASLEPIRGFGSVRYDLLWRDLVNLQLDVFGIDYESETEPLTRFQNLMLFKSEESAAPVFMKYFVGAEHFMGRCPATGFTQEIVGAYARLYWSNTNIQAKIARILQ